MDRDREPMVSLDGLWRFHPGDDPHWADPTFDDSHWPLIRSTRGWSEQGYRNMGGVAWYRARVFIPEAREPLSLYIFRVATSYELFVDGKSLGKFGGMPPHERPYVAAAQSFRLPQNFSGQEHTSVIAIRVWHWPLWATYVSGGLRSGIRIGPPELIGTLSRLRAHEKQQQSISTIIMIVLESLAGLAGLVLFAFRPKEKEYLWFGVLQLATALSNSFDIAIDFHPVTIQIRDLVDPVGFSSTVFFQILFYYSLLRGKLDRWFWLAVTPIVAYALIVVPLAVTWQSNVAVWVVCEFIAVLPSMIWIVILVVRRAIQGITDARLLLIPVLVNKFYSLAAEIVAFVNRMGWWKESESSLNYTWQQPFPISISDLITFAFLLAIVAILIRRFIYTSQHQERLASELQAARAVQLVLIPNEIPLVPGFTIEAVYQPASEVDGDFFQVIPTCEGGILAIIGDVSGKGVPTAMTVSFLVGTVRTLAQYSQSPAEILGVMNQHMLARSGDGFTTCLIVRIDVNGMLTVANAGHLPPYLDGAEVEVEGGLPLGLVSDSTYENLTMRLAGGAKLTLITDGIVEARNSSGELLGFERARSIVTNSATAIARIAQDFGQEDDITVLKLSLVESLHSIEAHR